MYILDYFKICYTKNVILESINEWNEGDFMSKKKLAWIAVGSFVSIFILYFFIHWVRIKTAKIEVVLKDDLTVEFAEEKRVSDFITSINGKIIDDKKVDTTKLGTKEIYFSFMNDDHIKVSYQFQIKVVDSVEPMIRLNSIYPVLKGSEIDLTKKIFCGDQYDHKPKCSIEGTYDMNTVGDYPLIFKAEDSSGNTSQKSFTLRVYEPVPATKQTPVEPTEPIYTDFLQVVKDHKKKHTKIGIDISSFQGEVDFKKLKQAGVEFVMIRIGASRGIGTELFLDKQFKRNMKEAKKHGIPTGVYLYSYANSIESAKKEAKWVIKQLKKYKLQLPVAFDWENWNYYNDYELSFFGLTSMAEAFAFEIEKAGYEAMIYSSKNYLEQIWFPTKYDIWLAHYTDQTNYQGTYKMWQLCEDGKVDGIAGKVDIDILYENKKFD